MKESLFNHHPMPAALSKEVSITPDNISHDFIHNLMKIIEDNLDDSLLCVDFLAANMALSKSTLNRKLSGMIGLSPNELIKQYRLRKAALFLLSGKNIAETAYSAGFGTPSYFTQCFKGFYKMTPKKYSKII